MLPTRLLVLVALLAGCVDLSRPTPEEGPGDAPMLPPDGRDAADVSVPDAPIDGPGAEASGGDSDGAGETADAEDGPAPDIFEPPPDMMPDAPLVANGRPCDQHVQCLSGVCADGVCCNRACGETCFACDLPTALGTCTAAPAGEDPDNDCTQANVSTCGLDGTCNGAGACRRYPVNTECGPATCSAGVEYSARTCDGNGTCRASASSRPCNPGVCMGNTCATTCTQQSQCLSGTYCDGTRCTSKKIAGAACGNAYECMSNYCVDGVCCNSPCGEMCYACNVAGTLGTCTAVPSGQGTAECPMESANTCGRAGGCNGAGACRLHPTGTGCGSTSCSGATETAAGSCNGLGVCTPGGPRSCAPYLCGGAACRNSCTSANDCVAGFTCTNLACVRHPNLVLHWRFEEGSGTTALDSTGNGYTGLYVNGPTPSAASLPPLMFPNALSRAFVMASRQAVYLENAPSALRPANNLTVSVWFRTSGVDSNGSGTMIGSELVSVGDRYLLRLRPDGVEASKDTSGGLVECRAQGSLPVFDNNWHHAAVAFSSSEGVRLYVDGVLQSCRSGSAQGNTSSITYGSDDDLWVGRHEDQSQTQWDFGGNLDELRLYNRALTAAEVAALAQGRN